MLRACDDHVGDCSILRDSLAYDKTDPDRPLHDVVVERFSAMFGIEGES
jgi:hypothetical protein